MCITSNFIASGKEFTIRKSPRTISDKSKEVSTERREISLLRQEGTTQFPHLHCHNSPELGSLIIEVCHSFFP